MARPGDARATLGSIARGNARSLVVGLMEIKTLYFGGIQYRVLQRDPVVL